MLRVILKFYLILAVFMVAGSGMFSTVAADSGVSQKQIVVKLQTTLGDIDIALESDKAPETVKNFLAYVDEGFYNGTIFHRIVPGFVIQGGGLEANRREKPTRSPIRNEAANGLKNDRYSVAMARTPEPHSATAQFYINLADNDNLNYTEPTWEGFGYAVFGKVILGQEVVDKIALAPETVSIIKALRVNSGASQ